MLNSYPEWRNFQFAPNIQYGFFFLHTLHATIAFKLDHVLFYNLIFFMFIRFPAILLVKTIDSYLHEFCARGILHSDFQ